MAANLAPGIPEEQAPRELSSSHWTIDFDYIRYRIRREILQSKSVERATKEQEARVKAGSESILYTYQSSLDFRNLRSLRKPT